MQPLALLGYMSKALQLLYVVNEILLLISMGYLGARIMVKFFLLCGARI